MWIFFFSSFMSPLLLFSEVSSYQRGLYGNAWRLNSPLLFCTLLLLASVVPPIFHIPSWQQLTGEAGLSPEEQTHHPVGYRISKTTINYRNGNNSIINCSISFPTFQFGSLCSSPCFLPELVSGSDVWKEAVTVEFAVLFSLAAT